MTINTSAAAIKDTAVCVCHGCSFFQAVLQTRARFPARFWGSDVY